MEERNKISLWILIGCLFTGDPVLASSIIKGSVLLSGSDGTLLPSTSYLNPMMYYRLDETNELTKFADVTGRSDFQGGGGNHLYGVISGSTNGRAASVSGQITNAYSNPLFPDPGETNTQTFVSGSPVVAVGHRWCVRFWMWRSGTDFETSRFARIGQAGGSETVNASIYGGNGILLNYFTDGITNTIGSASGIGDSTWGRIVIWRDKHELGIQINDGAPETISFTNSIVDYGVRQVNGLMWQMKENVADYIDTSFDEIAVWDNYVPTAWELDYDWAGGSGLTYPFNP